ncbi:hypothetical protein J132_00730 [Termitomyces sp. J132]|nr:hypothetical protein J132_00730 [Termitomyces sp. J132]
MLSNCKTRLTFDDFVSDPIYILNSTTQGCPLSMLFYAFYNVPLILTVTPNMRSKSVFGFIDDMMSLRDTHGMLSDMMERVDGRFNWSVLHNPPFELSKLALMDFPCFHCDATPKALTIICSNGDGTSTTQVIKAVSTYKYLRVVFDPKLCWSAHH